MTAIVTEPEVITRTLADGIKVRSIDEDKRSAVFVAATENGVETWQGREYLRMKGADLERYRSNPVVLDTHNRYEAGAVIGSASIKVKARELLAEITFAETERAEAIWQLVKDGFLRALSIGFLPSDVQSLLEDESSGTGKNKIEGPARIIQSWELYEISVVPVPADADALRRSFVHGDPAAVELLARRVADFLKEKTMATETKESPPAAEPQSEAPATTETTEPKPQADSSPTDRERQTRDLKAVHESIRAIAPEGCKDIAAQCILEGKSLEESRAILLVKAAERTASVGTPEPEAPTKTSEQADKERKIEDVSDDELRRSLCG